MCCIFNINLSSKVEFVLSRIGNLDKLFLWLLTQTAGLNFVCIHIKKTLLNLRFYWVFLKRNYFCRKAWGDWRKNSTWRRVQVNKIILKFCFGVSCSLAVYCYFWIRIVTVGGPIDNIRISNAENLYLWSWIVFRYHEANIYNFQKNLVPKKDGSEANLQIPD